MCTTRPLFSESISWGIPSICKVGLICVVFQQRTEIGYGSDENPLVMLAWKCHNLKALTYIGKNNALVFLAPYLYFKN